MPIVSYILVALGAYLLGSIPFGYLVAKAKGVDIRKSGSGNIGATNAMRVLGKPAGIFVLLMDALKGYAAVVWLTPAIYNWMAAFYNWAGLPLHQPDDVGLHAIFGLPLRWAAASVSVHTQFMVLAGVCAVLGHNYTCWLKFKGGKGIATSAGVFLALAPWAVLVALGVFILAVLLTKYVSVGSIAAAIALSATVWIMTPHNILLGVVTTALSLLAIYKHKSNIQRLMAGTENRLGQKKAGSTP